MDKAALRAEAERKAQDVQSDDMRRLKAELKRVTEERDILKKAAVYFAKTSRYRKRKWRGGDAPSVVAPNHL